MFERFRKRESRAAVEALPGAETPDFAVAATRADVIALLHAVARDLAGADGITVVERRGDEIEYLTEDAVAPLWSGHRFPVRSCVTGMAMIANAPIVIPDIATDPRVPLHLYLSTFVRSMAVFPIGHDAPTMALGLYWRTTGPASDAALARIADLARAAGDALARVEASPRAA
ncbi:GAF domain-containing protein [Sphingomonas donggukensis]|uniref:GAF domain-containing protein n=1 Tax=Sphingomonas donggukensis TaxID=2949093 RepID=A0ABY4TV92_9SPHN|nr:GAF domain-containing protein [Sphingomonas donggukensis]URW76320.1 GAF domain-containing protein [Sphingomonas donggukensis]